MTDSETIRLLLSLLHCLHMKISYVFDILALMLSTHGYAGDLSANNQASSSLSCSLLAATDSERTPDADYRTDYSANTQKLASVSLPVKSLPEPKTYSLVALLGILLVISIVRKKRSSV